MRFFAVVKRTIEPTLAELLLMFVLMLLVAGVLLNTWSRIPKDLGNWSDNGSYLQVIDHLRGSPITEPEPPVHFWDFPYAILLLSWLSRISDIRSLVVLCILFSLCATVMIRELYGGWVAAFFLVIDYEWIHLSILGGNEPLFMVFLYGSFLAWRRRLYLLAAGLASLATVTRPIGILALIAFGILLVKWKRWGELGKVIFLSSAIGGLYLWHVARVFGTPFANFVGYRRDWGASGFPFTYPLHAIIPSYIMLAHQIKATSVIWFAIWPVAAVVGLWAPFRRINRTEWNRPELFFAFAYCTFLYVYNLSVMSENFSRFLIPVLPILIWGMRDCLPKSRAIIWSLALICSVCSVAALVGFRTFRHLV